MKKRIVAFIGFICLLSGTQEVKASKWHLGAVASGATGIVGTALLGYSLYQLYGPLQKEQLELEKSGLNPPAEQETTGDAALLQQAYDRLQKTIDLYTVLAWTGGALDLCSAVGLGVCLYKIYNPSEPNEALLLNPELEALRQELEAARTRRSRLGQEREPITFSSGTQTDNGQGGEYNRRARNRNRAMLPQPPEHILQGGGMRDIPADRRREAHKQAYFIALANEALNKGVPLNIYSLTRNIQFSIPNTLDRESGVTRYRHHRRMISNPIEDSSHMRPETVREKELAADILLAQAGEFLTEYRYRSPERAINENVGNMPGDFTPRERAIIVRAARSSYYNQVTTIVPNLRRQRNSED